MVKTDNTHRSRDLVNKRLTAIRKRYFPKDKDNTSCFERIWKGYQEAKSRAEPTLSLDLLPTVPCPVRYQEGDAYYCNYGAPLRTERKLRSLKRCETCLAKNKDKLNKITIQKANLDLSNIRGHGQTEKLQLLKKTAEMLANEPKKYCPIVVKPMKLLELPCVSQTKNFTKEEHYGCRFRDCEAQVKQYVKAYYLEA